MRPRSTRLLAMLSVVVLAVVLPACSSSAALPIHHRDESDAIRITRVDALHFTSGRAGWAILTLASSGQQDVARTVNGGHLWILSRAVPTGVRAYLHVVSSNTVYVLLQSQTGQVTVLRTVNGGKTWLSVAIPTPGIDDSWTGSFGARSTSWLLSCAPPSLSGTQCELFRTMHGGLHWQHLSSFPVVGLIPNGVTFIANDGLRVRTIAVTPPKYYRRATKGAHGRRYHSSFPPVLPATPIPILSHCDPKPCCCPPFCMRKMEQDSYCTRWFTAFFAPRRRCLRTLHQRRPAGRRRYATAS